MVSVSLATALLVSQSTPSASEIEQIVLNLEHHSLKSFASSNGPEHLLEAEKKANEDFQNLPPSSAPALTKLLEKVTWPATYTHIANLLIEFDYKPSIQVLVDDLQSPLPGIEPDKQPAFLALEKWGYKSTPALLRSKTSPDSLTRRQILTLLCERAWNERENKAVTDVLFSACQSPLAEERAIAAKALRLFTFALQMNVNNSYVAPTELQSEQGLYWSCRLALKTSFSGPPGAVYQYLGSHLRIQGLEWLGSYSSLEKRLSPEDTKKVQRALSGDDWTVAMAACTFVFNEHSIASAVRDTTASPHPRVRDFAIYAFKQKRAFIQEKDLPIATHHLQHPDPQVRLTIVNVLTLINHPTTRPYLEKLKSDPNPKVRAAANQAIERLKEL